MDSGTWALFGMTLVIAMVDWVAVHTANERLEYIAKPATMVALFLATLSIDPLDDTARLAFLIAIVFSLGGDIFLMLPKDLFVFGLASFLVGHIAYVVGMANLGVESSGLMIGTVIVVISLILVGPRIIKGVRDSETPEFLVPVVAYIAVISVMVVMAGGTEIRIALVGAVLFYASDAAIAWTRFVDDFPNGRLLVITTYHLGQIGIVLSLAA